MSMNSNAVEQNQLGGRDAAVRQMMRPLKELLEQPDVVELAINRPGEVWEKRFGGWTRRALPELTPGRMASINAALVSFNQVGNAPRLSLVLPDGERCELVTPPAVVSDVAMTIRKHAPVVKTLEDLEEGGSFDHVGRVSGEALGDLDDIEHYLLELRDSGKITQFLTECVRYQRNIVVAGKTGSGKTTFARSLIEKVPSDERIITIEDTHELFLDSHPNRVHLLFGHGEGRISASECLMSCMRLSPDRIFLAELRQNEAWEYITSLNTGHPGAVTTVHANSALSTFDRIADLIKQSDVGKNMDRSMITSVLVKTIDVVLYYEERKLKQIYYDPAFAKSQGI